MGRIKKGFTVGSIVVCIKGEWSNGNRFITVGKEYTVLSYWHMPNKSSHSILNSENYPKIMIKGDTIGQKLIPCIYFMPKDEYVRKLRNNKLSQII